MECLVHSIQYFGTNSQFQDFYSMKSFSGRQYTHVGTLGSVLVVMDDRVCNRQRVGTSLTLSQCSCRCSLLYHRDLSIVIRNCHLLLWPVLGALHCVKRLIEAQFNLRYVLRLGLLQQDNLRYQTPSQTLTDWMSLLWHLTNRRMHVNNINDIVCTIRKTTVCNSHICYWVSMNFCAVASL